MSTLLSYNTSSLSPPPLFLSLPPHIILVYFEFLSTPIFHCNKFFVFFFKNEFQKTTIIYYKITIKL